MKWYTVVVGVLHIFSFDIRIFKLVGGVKSFFRYGTGNHVLQLGAHECGALAGLHVLEFNDLQDVALPVVKRNSVFEIASYYHNLPPIKQKVKFAPAILSGHIVIYIVHQKLKFCKSFFLLFSFFFDFFTFLNRSEPPWQEYPSEINKNSKKRLTFQTK
jgi:hypothetical protein